MIRKAKHISILQFDARSLSVVRVRRSSQGVEVVSAHRESGSWRVEDGSLEEALGAFVKEHGVAAGAVYTVLPRHEMTTRILTVPSQEPSEIHSMVRLSAEEYVPYPVEELVVSCGILENLRDGHARVLAVFAHRDLVESHLDMLRRVGGEPEEIFVSTACLASAVMGSGGGAGERMALVNVGTSGLDILVFDGARLEYSRGVGLIHDGAGAEATAEVSGEVRASLSAYRRESDIGSEPERVYVSSEWGEDGVTTDIAAAIESEVGIESRRASFADSLARRGAAGQGAVSLVSLGAALAAQQRAAVSISLTPESHVRERTRRRFQSCALKAGAFFLALLVLAGVSYGRAVYARREYARELEARIAEVKPAAEVAAARLRRLKTLQERIGRKGTVVELLGHLCEAAPGQGLSIHKFTFKDGEGIVVEGQALSIRDVDRFADALRALGGTEVPLFKLVRSNWREASEFEQRCFAYKIEIPFIEENAGEPEQEGRDE